jgi:hypothetical protein
MNDETPLPANIRAPVPKLGAVLGPGFGQSTFVDMIFDST